MLQKESVPLLELTGRILACDILSSEAIPAWDNSSMDGFAVNAALTRSASDAQPVYFQVVDSVSAGDSEPKRGVAEADEAAAIATAVQIMTGAPMPQDCSKNGQPLWDAVVKIEDVELHRDAGGVIREISLKRPLKPGENVRLRASDYTVGKKVAGAGACVTPDLLLWPWRHSACIGPM